MNPRNNGSMLDSQDNRLQRQIDQQNRLVQGLQVSVYGQANPADDVDLLAKLAQAQSDLVRLQTELKALSLVEELKSKEAPAQDQPRGRFLGEQTTGLRVEPTLRMDPLPTGAYHLMDPETEPLLTVEVDNVSRDRRRVCVKAHLEGLSAQAVKTIEVEPRNKARFDLQPTLFPDRAKAIAEIQRATLHLIVEDLDGKLECHDTYPVTCLARTASFNSVCRPDTGELLDLSHYYGAWVTPHADTVQERIRRAVELSPGGQMMGYQGDPDLVVGQVGALYESIRETQIVYVNSVIDYGAPAGMTTQRARLPRESLAQRSANCIDGTLLLASLIEGSSLNPAIVLVPGHAFLGWEKWFGSGEWQFLETTMIGSAEFKIACESGQRQYEQFQKFGSDKVKLHSLQELRSRGIWPME